MGRVLMQHAYSPHSIAVQQPCCRRETARCQSCHCKFQSIPSVQTVSYLSFILLEAVGMGTLAC